MNSFHKDYEEISNYVEIQLCGNGMFEKLKGKEKSDVCLKV